MLKTQRALPVIKEFCGEKAKVVAGRWEIEALVRPVLQEGASDELGRVVAEGDRMSLRRISGTTVRSQSERESVSGGALEANALSDWTRDATERRSRLDISNVLGHSWDT